MEIDAVLMLVQMIRDDIVDDNSFLIMQSYINNKNININLSIRENARLIVLENEELGSNEKIASIISSEDEYLDVPIYSLLLERKKIRNLLIYSSDKGNLEPKSLVDIIEAVLTGIECIDDDIEKSGIMRFLMDFLSKNRLKSRTDIQNSQIINAFVKKKVHLLFDDKRNNEKCDKGFFDRMLLYKLFSCGYVTFDYNQILDSESTVNGLEEALLPLIENRSYGHIRLMINKVTVKAENIALLKETIKKGFRSLYEYEPEVDDAKKDKDFITNINVFFSMVGSETLNYDEMVGKGVVMK